MEDKTPNLSTAYALKTPEDSRRLYADWAESYDATFAGDEDYQLHVHTAQAFVRAGGHGPVLDVGAGTGLCGNVLASMGVEPIDAADISPDMLGKAMEKGIYRKAIEADLTQPLPIAANSYAGLVSSGTFTTGHVGPQAIQPLLEIARAGAQFALSINSRHFQSAGFAAAFDDLAQGQISGLSLLETPIYGERATGAHAGDTALIALFRKSG